VTRALRVLAPAALAALAACGQASRDRRDAERTIRGYDDASILAYRTRDLEPLKRFATAGEWGRVVVLVDLKTAGKLVLESELLSLELDRVERAGPDALVAETRERWRYHDRPLDPGAPRPPTFVADMRMRYELVRAEGSWRVDRTRTLENTYVEPKGFRLDAHAPPGHGAPPASPPAAPGASER
jgi:hypothetical protein